MDTPLTTARIEQVMEGLRGFVDRQSQFWNPEKQASALFHYSSPEGFIGIVTSKTLWASDMLSLNDASEASYTGALISDVLDAHHSEAPADHRQQFKTQLTEHLFRLYMPYVACFCEGGDLLSQWRGYGNAGEGFALGFSFSWLKSLEKSGWRLQKVIYDRDQQVNLILMFLRWVSSELAKCGLPEEDHRVFWRTAAAQLAPWVTMFKNPAFQEEQEWRIVNIGPVNRLSFRRSGHRIVPYVKVPLANEAISRVIRGPFFRGSDTRGAHLMLVSHGFVAGAHVCDSQIPIRA